MGGKELAWRKTDKQTWRVETGGGAHSPGEFVVIRRMPERAALLARLLLTL